MIHRHRQRGLGMFGLMAIVGVVGLAFKIGFALFPVYMNEMKLNKAVTRVAGSAPETATPSEIRKLLQPTWDIDDIVTIMPADVKVKKTATGRALGYDYESRVPVFANVFLVVVFSNEVPMRPGANQIP